MSQHHIIYIPKATGIHPANLLKLNGIKVSQQFGSVHIEAISAKNQPISNFGFKLPQDASVLRSLSQAFTALAQTIEHQDSGALQVHYDDLETTINGEGYTIENCVDFKGQFYYFHSKTNYASANFHRRIDAIDSAHAELSMTPQQIEQHRV